MEINFTESDESHSSYEQVSKDLKQSVWLTLLEII